MGVIDIIKNNHSSFFLRKFNPYFSKERNNIGIKKKAENGLRRSDETAKTIDKIKKA